MSKYKSDREKKIEKCTKTARQCKIFFKENLVELLDIQKIKYSQLAETLKVDRSVVSNYIAGYTLPEWGTLYELAGFFGVSVSDLLFGSPVRDLNSIMKSAGKVIDFGNSAYEPFISTVEGKTNPIFVYFYDSKSSSPQLRAWKIIIEPNETIKNYILHVYEISVTEFNRVGSNGKSVYYGYFFMTHSNIYFNLRGWRNNDMPVIMMNRPNIEAEDKFDGGISLLIRHSKGDEKWNQGPSVQNALITNTEIAHINTFDSELRDLLALQGEKNQLFYRLTQVQDNNADEFLKKLYEMNGQPKRQEKETGANSGIEDNKNKVYYETEGDGVIIT